MKEKKQPAKTTQGLYHTHSEGLKRLAKQSHSELRQKARREWKAKQNEDTNG